MGAALQLGGGLQRRASRKPHLHRADCARAAGLDPRARGRAAGRVDVPLPGRDGLRQSGPRLGQAVPRAERLAREAARCLLPRQAGRRLPALLPRRARAPLPPGAGARHHPPAGRGLPGPPDQPAAGRGVRHTPHLRHDPRPYAREDLPPRGGLQRVAGAAQIPDTELEHGHGVQRRAARPAHLPPGRAGAPHDRPHGRPGQLRHRGRVARRAGGPRRQGRAAAHRARLLGPCGRGRQRGPGGRRRHRIDARPRPPGRGRQGPAPPAHYAERPVGHGHRHGGRHGRGAGAGQPRPQRPRRVLREHELRHRQARRAGLGLQAGDDAGPHRGCGHADRDGIRHGQRTSGRGGRRPGAGFARGIQRHGLQDGRGAVLERLLRRGGVRALCRPQGALLGVPALAPPRPHGGARSLRRAGSALPGRLEEDRRCEPGARTPQFRLRDRAHAHADGHTLQRRGQRRPHGGAAPRARGVARRSARPPLPSRGARGPHLLALHAAHRARVPRGGVPHGYGRRILPRHDALPCRGQDRHGAVLAGRNPLFGRILHGQHGGLRAGRETPLYHLRDHPHAPRGRQSLLRRPPRGSRGQAPGLPHLQPRARLARPRGAERRALPPGADERGRRGAGAPRGEPPGHAPRAERRPHGMGAHAHRQRVGGDRGAAARRAAHGARRAGHGPQGGAVPARKPRPARVVHGPGLGAHPEPRTGPRRALRRT